jgi:hypothetical protein
MSLGDIWGAKDEPQKADIGALMEKAAYENRMHMLRKIEKWFTGGPGVVMSVAEMETALGIDHAEAAQLIQGVAAEIWTSARTITVFNAFDKLKSEVEAEQAGLV